MVLPRVILAHLLTGYIRNSFVPKAHALSSFSITKGQRQPYVSRNTARSTKFHNRETGLFQVRPVPGPHASSKVDGGERRPGDLHQGQVLDMLLLRHSRGKAELGTQADRRSDDHKTPPQAQRRL